MVVGGVAGVGFGGGGQVEHGLGEGELAFGRTEAFVGVGGFVGDGEGAGVGQADVFPGHADDAAGEVAGVGAAVEHAAEPVEGGVGVGAAHGFVQGGDLVVEAFAAFVETADLAAEAVGQEVGVEMVDAAGGGGAQELFEQVEQAAGIAVGGLDEQFLRVCFEAEAAVFGQGEHFGGEPGEFVCGKGLQHVNLGAAEQGGVDFEGGVFGGGADEGEQAAFHIGQEGVLLGFVEAVDFIDE